MTKDEFYKEIKEAADEFYNSEVFIQGAAKARELMMGEVERLYKQINTYAKEQNYQYKENKKLRADLALAMEALQKAVEKCEQSGFEHEDLKFEFDAIDKLGVEK